jgi:hypothetical protein
VPFLSVAGYGLTRNSQDAAGHARHICKDCERINRAKRRKEETNGILIRLIGGVARKRSDSMEDHPL